MIKMCYVSLDDWLN